MPKGIYKRKPFTEIAKQNMSLAKLGNKNSFYGKKHTEKTKQLMLNNKNALGNKHMLGKKLSDITKQKIRLKQMGNKYSAGRKLSESHIQIIKFVNSGRKHSKEAKKKMRIFALNRFLKDGMFVGKNEKQILDRQEQLDNCKIIRQFIIHPLGYIADGYCQETNTIYEVYEKHHLGKIKKERDIKRQQLIQEHLHCDFKIIWDK